jgi:hypothetical protein
VRAHPEAVPTTTTLQATRLERGSTVEIQPSLDQWSVEHPPGVEQSDEPVWPAPFLAADLRRQGFAGHVEGRPGAQGSSTEFRTGDHGGSVLDDLLLSAADAAGG